MINLKIQGKSVKVPTKWQDVTFRQYQQLSQLKENSVLDLIAIFTNTDKKIWEQSKEVENFYLIEKSLAFILKEPKFKKVQCPAEVEINGIPIKVPIGDYIVKEYEDMRALLQIWYRDHKEVEVELYPKLIACFMGRKIFGSYDSQIHEKTVSLIEGLKLYEVIGMGNFFLKSLNELRTSISRGLRLWNTMRKKLTPVFVALRYGAFSIRSTS